MATIASDGARYALGAWGLGAYPLAGEGEDLPSSTPGTQPGDLITVEMAPGEDPFAPGAGAWVDYSGRVRSVSIVRGRTIETGQYPASTATVVLDSSDRVVDPFEHSDMRANMPIRISVVADGNTRRLFTGYVDSIPLEDDFPSLTEVSISATDGFKFLARDELAETTYTGKDPDGIVTTILDDIGWPAGARDIDTDIRETEDFTFAGASIGLLDIATTVEGPTSGRWIAPNGDFVWKNRRAITNDIASTAVQVTFSNLDTDTDVSRYTSIIRGVDEGTLFNKALVTRDSNGYEATTTDATSITANGPLGIAVGGPFDTDSDCDDDADLLVELFKDQRPRISGISLRSCDDGPIFDDLMLLDLRHRVRVKHTPPGGGSAIDVDLLVEAIAIQVVKDGSGSRFSVRYTFGDAERYDDMLTALGASY